MTDSVLKRPGKRERLIASAARIVHEQGLQGATLARVAEAADVPLGNVYYYFKTRDDLIRAVVGVHAAEVEALLSELDGRSDPAARLRGLARNWSVMAEVVAEHGCPIGSLSADLAKLDGELAACSEPLLRTVVNWATGQFRELGLRDARPRAIELVGRVQGAALLANVFGDAKILTAEVRRIERGVDELAHGVAKPGRG